MPFNSDVTFLIVENDPASLEICRNIISMRFPKAVVHIASNTAEAVYKHKYHKHDIILTDLFSPKQEGIVIAREICEANPKSVVIFITADTDAHWDTLKHKANRLCLKGIIHKPIDINEVIDKITDAINIIGKRSEK